MPISLQRRLLYVPVIHIDTNLINARQKLPAVNQIEKWFEDGVILINMSGTAQVEARVGNNAQRTRKANQQISTVTPGDSNCDPLYRRVEATLFPGGAQTKNQKHDVVIVCVAAEYNAILVTSDGGSKSQPGGILGNRQELVDSVQIMTPDETVKFIRRKIKERDEFNRRVEKEFCRALPPWTGND